jgi:hypothetical protein
MKVCGIEIKGNNAILTCLDGDIENYEVVSKEVKKIGLEDF